MVPRADALYQEIERLEYLFPYPNVKKGSNIILYGMGTYGQRLYKYINQSGFCSIVALVDRNDIELRKQGLPVESLDNIAQYKFDAIVIASSFAKTRDAIYKELTTIYGDEIVHKMDENLIKSEITMSAFGLM